MYSYWKYTYTVQEWARKHCINYVLHKFKDRQTSSKSEAALQYLRIRWNRDAFPFKKKSLESILYCLYRYDIKNEEVNSPHQRTEAFMFTSYQQQQELAEQFIFRVME